LKFDHLAIVLSILLAFAIDAWWQDRAEYREETSALRALRDEFEANRKVLARYIAFHSDLHSSTLAVLQLAADPDAEIAAEDVDRMIGDVAWWGSLVSFESAALDAVILSAKLDLLNNEELRRMLADWRSQLASTSSQNAQEFEHFYGTLLPILRALINDREFQNTVVEKFWIEEDMLRQYRILEPKIEKLLETLNSEIADRVD